MVFYVRWVVCLVMCGLLLGACAPTPPRDHFAYAGKGFEVTVRGSFTPAELPGEGTASAGVTTGRPAWPGLFTRLRTRTPRHLGEAA